MSVRIPGLINDTNGQPMPGVTVTVSSDNLVGMPAVLLDQMEAVSI